MRYKMACSAKSAHRSVAVVYTYRRADGIKGRMVLKEKKNCNKDGNGFGFLREQP